MSEQTKKENRRKQKGKAEAEEEERSGGLLGYVIGGVLGLLILLGIWGITRSTPPREREELPQLAVVVEFNDLSSTQTRQAIAKLQRALLTTGEMVLGPSNYPILLPGKSAEDLPTPHNLEDLTPEQWKTARPYFFTSHWLIPRVYAPDLKSCVLRVFPKGVRFGPQIRRKVEEVLSQFKGSFNKIWRYSYDLGLTDPEHQAAINVNFGVQTANVVAISNDNGLNTMARLQELSDKLNGYTDSRIRSKATMADFYHYLRSVQTGSPQPLLKIGPLEDRRKEVDALVRRCHMPRIVQPDGSTAVVLVTTGEQGKKNLELCYHIAANLSVDRTTFHPNR